MPHNLVKEITLLKANQLMCVDVYIYKMMCN